MIQPIKACRVCGNTELKSIIDLGFQALTGVFPHSLDQPVIKGPLELVQCTGPAGAVCGLLQLRHHYPMEYLYGEHYGYRSSLNQSMVVHLSAIVQAILSRITLKSGDIVLDIGSNDGTLLKAYRHTPATLVGIDPAARKFKKYYPDNVNLINDFFAHNVWRKVQGQKRAKVITSIAMFYDLEQPQQFMQDVYDCLTDDGVWCFEQSYMPAMLKHTSYDTICHEHFEYYGLAQIKWMTDRVGFKIIDVAFNDTNGGSFMVMVAKKDNSFAQECTAVIDGILKEETALTGSAFTRFREDAVSHRTQLQDLLRNINKQGKKVFGYGASTKGNVILQYAGLSSRDLPCIAEVNEDKFGCFTPGTGIPIISEQQAKQLKPDYFLVLPWHFKANIIAREKEYLTSGGRLLFPLPSAHIYGKADRMELEGVHG